MSNVTIFKDVVIDGTQFSVQYDELNRGHRLLVQAYGDDLISPWREMTAKEITNEITSRIENCPLFDLNVNLEVSGLDQYKLANGVETGSNDYIWEVIAATPITEDIVGAIQEIIRGANLGFKLPNIYVETFSSKYASDPDIGKNLLPTLKEHIITFYGDRPVRFRNLHVKEIITILKQKLNNTLLENNVQNTAIINIFSLGHAKDVSGKVSLTDNFAVSFYSENLDDIPGTADEVLEKIQDFITDLNFSAFHGIWIKTGSALQGATQFIY